MENIVRLPGLIDPHVHFRTPGQEQKEDFTSGTSAAIAGGFTIVIDMPNNSIPITTKERLAAKKELAKKQTLCDIGFYFGSLGDNLDEFAHIDNQVKGLKLYLNETTGNFLINREVMEKIFAVWSGNTPIMLHAEDDAVAAVIEIVRETRKKAHFCHISLRQIIKAKKEGLPITCGVTPHHLFLTEVDTARLQSLGQMKPPLRSEEERAFLWEHLDSIDVIESDHAPHMLTEKEQSPSPYGVPGLETTLPLLLTAVNEKKITLEEVKRLCFTNAARIWNIQEDSSTYIEVDMNEVYLVNRSKLYTKCGWSPFEGREMRGKLRKTVIRGTTVFENGKILVEPGFGKVL
jgi:dihydroorotase-like cyclic amidohydrolase